MVVSGQPHVPAALALGKELRFQLNRKPRPQGQCGRSESMENSLAPTVSRNKIPLLSSPQPDHYTDWAIQASRHG
jgi:hypothetical protein